MDTLAIIESLNEAIRIIQSRRLKHLACGAHAIWQLSDHAENHLNKQIRALLAPAE